MKNGSDEGVQFYHAVPFLGVQFYHAVPFLSKELRIFDGFYGISLEVFYDFHGLRQILDLGAFCGVLEDFCSFSVSTGAWFILSDF